MDIHELGKRSYLNEDWYMGQDTEWENLIALGWSFARPAYLPTTEGIQIHRGRDSAEFRVDASLPKQEIHEKLLRYCQVFVRDS